MNGSGHATGCYALGNGPAEVAKSGVAHVTAYDTGDSTPLTPVTVQVPERNRDSYRYSESRDLREFAERVLASKEVSSELEINSEFEACSESVGNFSAKLKPAAPAPKPAAPPPQSNGHDAAAREPAPAPKLTVIAGGKANGHAGIISPEPFDSPYQSPWHRRMRADFRASGVPDDQIEEYFASAAARRLAARSATR